MARREVISCRVDAAGVPVGISRDVALCLFRVAQEALNNVVRHAKASSVDVELASKGSGLQLRIRDNGRGFDPANGHEHPSLGLASMRERVRLLHGKLDVDSRPGGGTTVLAWVPWGATAMKRARVLLADDHRMVAEGLRRLLEPEFELVGIVEDGSALLEGRAGSNRTWWWPTSRCLA